MSFPVVAMQERVKAHNPQMVAYAQRIQQRPAFKKAKEAGGLLVDCDDLNLIFLPVHREIRHSGNLLSNAYRRFNHGRRLSELSCYRMMWMCRIFEDLQDYVLNQIQQPSVVVAQSMGGIFAVQAAQKNLSRCRLWYLWQPQAVLI